MRGPGKPHLAAIVVGLIAAHVHGFAQDTPAPAPPPVTVPLGQIAPIAAFEVAGERRLLATADAVWIASREASTLSRVDVQANKVIHSIPLGGPPCGAMTFAFGSVWVPLCATGLARLDPKTNKVSATVTTTTPAAHGAAIAAVGSIWTIADDRGTILRIDPDTNRPVAEIYTQRGATAMAFAADALWIAAPPASALVRLNPHTNVITQTVKVTGGPTALAFADGAVWTLNGSAANLTRIDVKTNTVTETIALGGTGAGALASGAGALWISRPGLPLARVDPRRNRVTHIFSGTGGGGAIAFGHDALWLAATATSVWRLDPALLEAMRAK